MSFGRQCLVLRVLLEVLKTFSDLCRVVGERVEMGLHEANLLQLGPQEVCRVVQLLKLGTSLPGFL